MIHGQPLEDFDKSGRRALGGVSVNLPMQDLALLHTLGDSLDWLRIAWESQSCVIASFLFGPRNPKSLTHIDLTIGVLGKGYITCKHNYG